MIRPMGLSFKNDVDHLTLKQVLEVDFLWSLPALSPNLARYTVYEYMRWVYLELYRIKLLYRTSLLFKFWIFQDVNDKYMSKAQVVKTRSSLSWMTESFSAVYVMPFSMGLVLRTIMLICIVAALNGWIETRPIWFISFHEIGIAFPWC